MTRLSILACAVLAAANPALAALKPASEASMALSSQQRCQWNTATGTDCTTEYAITVLQEAAREEGTQQLTAHINDKLELLEAYTELPDGKRLAVAERDTQRGVVPGESGFAGYQFMKIAFPEVRVGSKLVLRYREQAQQIRPFTELSTSSHLYSGVRLDKMVKEISADKPLHWQATGLDGALKVERAADGKTLRLETTKPLYRAATESGRRFKLRDTPRLDISTEPSLERFEQPGGVAFDKLLQDALPSQAQRAVNKAKSKPWREAVALLVADVNERIRYMGDWRLSENGFVPFSLREIEQRGFGDCKDMALTLTAMLRAAGFDANVAFGRADRDNTPPMIVSMGYLNHAFVHLQMDGKDYWLDPTHSVYALGSVSPGLEDRPAWVVQRGGEVVRKQIALNEPQSRLEQQETDFTAVDGKHWQVSGKTVLRGRDVKELFDGELEDGREAADRALFSDSFLFEGMTALDYRVTRGALQRLVLEPYAVAVSGHAENVTRPLGAFRLADLRVMDKRVAELRDYYAKQGVSDYLMETHSIDSVVRLRQVKPLAAPQACSVRSPWLDFDLEPVAVADGVGIRQRLQRKAGWVKAAELNSSAFRRMVDELEACDGQAQILLQK